MESEVDSDALPQPGPARRKKMVKRQLRIRIKYCGGCNPDIDRGSLVKHLASLLMEEGIEAHFMTAPAEADLLLLINGCPHACLEEEYAESGRTMAYISVQGARLSYQPVPEEELAAAVGQQIRIRFYPA
ncbi:MAG: hypothetical protein JSW39_17190 [Desulfobacterales bacterium]|nr:MAG: hypothetical protein JSW39_17190 [Desulfobacterales bacterium]